ncbi:amidase family protein [Acidocella sp. MX-AZ03]|nr:amidase family protein [Acidocella sp. MX-AZ03]WBO58148.1 amidase family protein [Acidocella sp. MX-AZ03]
MEVTKAALARAEAINPALNAFTFLDRDGALAEAKASEARWRMGAPLSEVDGVPTTLKDIVWVQGWAVRYGSETTDATPWRRMRLRCASCARRAACSSARRRRRNLAGRR